MIAIKAQYNDGKIELLEPIPPEIHRAKLNIVIIPDEPVSGSDNPVEKYFRETPDSLKDFQLTGLQSFFDTEDDRNVDWDEVFGLKEKKA
jgi:hypothetical protein